MRSKLFFKKIYRRSIIFAALVIIGGTHAMEEKILISGKTFEIVLKARDEFIEGQPEVTLNEFEIIISEDDSITTVHFSPIRTEKEKSRRGGGNFTAGHAVTFEYNRFDGALLRKYFSK